MQALDELVARWRKNPDPEATLALCAHLGTTQQAGSHHAGRQAELIREVANLAETWHRDNHPVMLSVGRMYLDAGLLAEAQAALVQAGKVEPNDAEAYRYLGEVLLRRGDAIRSEKTLARAIHMGDDDAETRLWHERAVLYVALQKRQGIAAVADEVARTAPHRPSIPSPTLSPFDRIDRETAAAASGTSTRTARRSRPPLQGAPRASGRRRPSMPGARRRGSTPPPPDTQLLGTKTEPQDTLIMGQSPVPLPPLEAPKHPPSPFVPSGSHAPKAARAAKKPSAAVARRPGSPAAQPEAATRARPRAAGLGSLDDALRELEAIAAQPGSEPLGDPFRGTFTEPPPIPHETAAALAPASPRAPDSPPFSTPAPSSTEPTSVTSSRPRAVSAPLTSEPASPTPEVVLSELARVGLYEQDSKVVPAWEAAPRPAPRRLWIMAGALAASVALGIGGYRYALGVRADRAAQAQALGLRLASALDSGSRAQLRDSESDFQTLFELDSRGQEAALLWLQNRALHALLENQPVSGIESALQRARAVGIEEHRLIFGRLASALAAGDLPGAGATIAEWDSRARGEALYQLLAGVVLERAGNPEALERYVEAARLQPDLELSHAYAARLSLLQLGPAASRSLVEIACARLGPGPASDVLRGLEWATSPFTDNKPPTVVAPEIAGDLSPLMQDTASAVVAVRARREGRLEESTAAFERALGPSATPAMAAWIGYQALDAGDVEIARRAALKAVQLSALHKGSHALAARIALAEGRLEAAREALRGVDPSSRDSILIELVSAYENLRGADAARLVASLPGDPAGSGLLAALAASDKVISGTLRAKDAAPEQLASEQRLWGSIIAVDVALDTGRLDLAERIATERALDGKVPAHAARLMRLERYRARGAAAIELAPTLLDAKAATPRAVAELVLTFVGEARAAAASSALESMRGAAGGLAPWLDALVEDARGREPSAAKLVAALEPPDRARPLLEQAVALRALAAVRDKRAKGYYAQLERRFRAHPDVALAGKELGLVK